MAAHAHEQLAVNEWRIEIEDSSWITASKNGVYFQVIMNGRKGGPTFVELVVADRD